MRKVFLFASALMLSLSFTSCERIDAGCEGILVNLYGSERGVDDVSMVTGRVFYNPATQEVFKYVKDACRIEINKFTTDQIVSNREAVEQAIEKRLSKLLDKEGFVLDQFTSGLQYPKTIVEAVDAKNRAIQLAQKAANEVQVAEAKKKIVVAEAIVNASLTPLLVKKQWIEAWDGHLPKVTGNSSTLVGLDK